MLGGAFLVQGRGRLTAVSGVSRLRREDEEGMVKRLCGLGWFGNGCGLGAVGDWVVRQA
jgi:hypothetical protein